MDFFEISRWAIKKMKLFLLYWRRIVFAKNHFKCPWYKKIRANICGGFLADHFTTSTTTTKASTFPNSTGIVQDTSTNLLISYAITR